MTANAAISSAGAGNGPIGLLEGLATTRAIRRYRDEPVDDGDLSTILWHATRAPSGSNRQPFRFLVLRDGPRATLAKALLGESFRNLWAEKRRRDGYDAGSGAEADTPKARMAATMEHFVEHFEATPVVILACLVRRRDPTPTEGASVYPACQNLLLAARALGYGGVMTMWHTYVDDELRKLLAIPDNVAISAALWASTVPSAAGRSRSWCSTMVGSSQPTGHRTRRAPGSPRPVLPAGRPPPLRERPASGGSPTQRR